MKEQDKPNTEQLILKAAEEEFFAKGYAGARTTAIAEKAGVTHAMLHYYFRTKDYLFERIVSKNVILFAQSFLAVLGNSDMPVVERLKTGISAHFDLIAAHPQLPRFILNEVILCPERCHLFYDRAKEIGEGLFANLQKDADKAAERGEMEYIDIRKLFISIVSLNIFPFLIHPFIENLPQDFLQGMAADKEKYFAERKAENIETIMLRIKKQ